MRSSIGAIIRKNSQKREPRPTGWQPMLAQLPGIKAVLFDVYGTLFISSAHSMQATDLAAAKAFSAALASVGRTGALYRFCRYRMSGYRHSPCPRKGASSRK